MKTLRSLIVGIIVLVLCVGGVFLYRNYSNPKSTTETTTVDIQGTIRDIGELATAEYDFTITQTAEKPSKTVVGVTIPFTSTKVLYSYNGVIKAGIQFSKVEITQNNKQKEIYVRIPEAEILSTEIDNKSLVVYDEKYSVFNTLTFEDMNISVDNAKTTANETAIDNGILDRANENARAIIQSTISALVDLSEYEMVFY